MPIAVSEYHDELVTGYDTEPASHAQPYSLAVTYADSVADAQPNGFVYTQSSTVAFS